MGYFARIARQSGLRYADHHVRDRASLKMRREAPAPIDVHEIVMVPPSHGEPMASPAPEIRQHTSPVDSVRAQTAGPPDLAGADPQSAPIDPAADPDAVRLVVAGERSTTEPSGEWPDAAPGPLPRPAAAENGGRGAPPEITATVAAGRSEDASVAKREAGTTVQVLQAPSEALPPARFFTRTAEMLAGPDADPIEIQTVVLREVREWIAGGPEPPPERAEERFEVHPEFVETEEAAPAPVLEPGVVRVGARRRPRTQTSPETPARLEEQTLDLSIGTISVVIEGEDAPRQPQRNQAQPRVERSTGETARHQGARLSRHYL